MKKILALLLALSMLFALTACGGDDETTPTGESTGETTSTTESTSNTTDGTEDSTQGTTEGTTGTETTEPPTTTPPTTTPPTTTPPTTTPPTTTPPTTTPPATDAPHTHSYSSKVTTAATCGKDGVKTFTCSCGDSYTEKIAATGQHSWGSWSTEACALVNRKGTDKRTCSTCSAAETRENTESVLANSFYDPGLEQIFYWGFNADGSPRAYSLLQYAPYRYNKFAYKVNSTDTIYDTLAKSFVLNSGFKDEMRAEGKALYSGFGYDEVNDTFTFEGLSMGSVGHAEPLGYVHNGGNQYTVYYSFEENGGASAQIYKVVVEFNRTDYFDVMSWKLNGEENKYLSFEKVSSVPSDLTK